MSQQLYQVGVEFPKINETYSESVIKYAIEITFRISSFFIHLIPVPKSRKPGTLNETKHAIPIEAEINLSKDQDAQKHTK